MAKEDREKKLPKVPIPAEPQTDPSEGDPEPPPEIPPSGENDDDNQGGGGNP